MSKAIEFIYKKTADRIKQKIADVGLPYNEIFSSDPKILSYIVNNKCDLRNKFLVPDRVFIDFKNTDGLIPKLFFPEENGKSRIPDDRLKMYKADILWGTEEERRGYAKKLFHIIMRELYDSNGDCAGFLCAFIPYAKAYTYNRVILSKENKYPALYYGL